jgi:hypothetical protein
MPPWLPDATASLAAVLKLAGQAERAENLLQSMDQIEDASAARAKYRLHLISGEPRLATTWLERLAESRFVPAAHLRLAQGLYPGPHWAPVARIMNLPEPPVE